MSHRAWRLRLSLTLCDVPLDTMSGFSRIRLGSLALAGIALFGLLGYRLVALQVFDHDWLAERARNQQEREFTLAAPRGSLIDRTGVVLARNGDHSEAAKGRRVST